MLFIGSLVVERTRRYAYFALRKGNPRRLKNARLTSDHSTIGRTFVNSHCQTTIARSFSVLCIFSQPRFKDLAWDHQRHECRGYQSAELWMQREALSDPSYSAITLINAQDALPGNLDHLAIGQDIRLRDDRGVFQHVKQCAARKGTLFSHDFFICNGLLFRSFPVAGRCLSVSMVLSVDLLLCSYSRSVGRLRGF